MEQVHEATLMVLEKTGLDFNYEPALALFAKAGCKVDGQRVYFPGNLVEAQIKKAPSQFTLYARNSEKNVTIGKDHIAFIPCYGTLSIGAPEMAVNTAATAQMGRFYNLPVRGGGALTDAKQVDSQAAYESMMSMMMATLSGINFVLHSAGILEGYITASYEKFIIDSEICGMCKRIKKGEEIRPEKLALDIIDQVGPGGEYLTNMHTFQNFKQVTPSKGLLRIEGRFPSPGDYRIHLCDQCGECAEVCPVEAITLENGVWLIDEDVCIACHECVEACPKDVMIINPETDIPAKCILCGECAEICPRQAIEIRQTAAAGEGK